MKNNVNRALRAKNNFNLFNRSEAQKNTLCASVNVSNASPRDDRDVTETLPRRYGWAKLAAALTLLLTLSVGQMWAYNMGGGTIYVDNYNKNWSSIRIYMWNGDWNTNWIFTNISGTDYWSCATPGNYSYGGYKWAEGAAGSWSGGQSSDIYADGAQSSWHTKCYSLNDGTWTVPGLKNVSYTSTTTAANVLAGSGTSGSPYIVKPGTSITVQLSGDLIDSDCTKYYKFGTSAASTTATKTVVASAVKGTSYSMEGKTGSKRSSYESRYASAGTLYFKTAYNISASVSGSHGSVSITAGGSYVYSGNTSFTITASPDTGYEVDTWSVSGGTKSGSGNTITVTASNTADCSVTVTFKEIPPDPAVSLSAAKTSGINVGETVRLTATGSNASNIQKYIFYEGSTAKKTVTTTNTTATYDYIPTTTGNKTVKVVMYYNSGSNTVESSSVSLTLNTPSVSLAVKSGSPTDIYLGETTTIMKATPSNVGAGVTPSYVFTDQAATPVTSGSQTSTEWTYTPGVTGTKTMKVTMTVGGSTYTATTTVNVYEHWNIYVKDNCGWGNIYNYNWSAGGEGLGSWPGTAASVYQGNWYTITFDSKYSSVVLHGNNNEKTNDISASKSSYAAGTFWDFAYTHEHEGTKYYNLHSVSLSDPQVTMDTGSEQTYMVNTTMLFATGHITNYGGDGTYPPDMLEVGFKIGSTEYPMTCMNTDNHYFWGYITGLTPGTSYTVKAYAKNIHGTGVSSNSKSLTTRASGTYTIQVQVPHNASAPYIYAYTDVDCDGVDVENAALPGIQLGSKVATGTAKDWWEYSMPTAYNNFIISNGNSSNQTRSFNAPQEDKCYWYDPSGGTEDDRGNEMLCPYLEPQLMINTPGAPTTFNYYEMSTSPTISKTMTLAAKSTYKFKIVYGAEWYGKASSPTLTRASNTLSGLDSQAGDEDHIQITTDAAGNYTFTFTAPGTIAVTYQEAYTVTFGYGTGGSDVTASATSAGGALTSGDYVAAGDNITFTQTPSSSGYTFKGWYTSAAGNTAVSGMGVGDNVLESIGANQTVYAQYTPNNYTVTFDATTNGGNCATESKSVTYGSTYGELPVATHAANTFIGWYTSASGEGTRVTAETIVSNASNHTLYARFESTYSVNVEFKCSGVTLYPGTTVQASASSLAADISAPEILGYRFVNWTGTNATFANQTSASTTVNVTSATTIVANYEVVPMVYFKNNLDWDSVFVSFDAEFVTAGIEGQPVPKNTGKPYYKMTQLGKTDVFYCVIPETYTASNYASWAWNIAFDNKGEFGNYTTTHTGNSDSFWKNEFLGRADFDPNATMYIPYNGDEETRNEGTYYPTGCWLQYNTTYSGYKINVWNSVNGNSGSLVRDVELRAEVAGSFEFTATGWLDNSADARGLKLYKDIRKNNNEKWYTNVNNEANTITSATTTLPWSFVGAGRDENWQRCRILPEVSGDYIFTVSFATGRPMVDIEYPVSKGDFRLVYKDQATWNNTHDASWQQISPVFKHKANRVDTASFFVSVGSKPTLELQKCTDITAGVETWTKQSDVSLSSIREKGVYNFTVTQSNDASSATAAYLGAYSGNYYIRTDASNGGWNNYKNGANTMTYSEYSIEHGGYTHYFMSYRNSGTNIKFVIANDYSPCISDTILGDTYTNNSEWLPAAANVRFMWDKRSNAISRAYLSGSTIVSDRFLVLEGDAKLFDENGNSLSISGLNPNEMNFTDDQNWIYEATVKAQPKAKIKLTAKYNNKIQYFYGDEGTSAEDSVLLLDGSGTDKYKVRVVYDFKTNRLIKAFIPEGTISTAMAINADLMIIREAQGDAQQINFSGTGTLSKVQTVYGAMKFNKWTVNNKEKTGGHGNLNWSRYKRDIFYISFPFDVKLSDVFGFGTYGKHWIIEYYDGKGRAANGYWADSDPNWKFVLPSQRNSFTLKAFEGYILALDLDELGESSSVWNNGVEDVYVYFPSSANVEDIQATSRTITIDQEGYECKIGPRFAGGDDRRVKDSYWHVIGVPSFANFSSTLYDTNEGTVIDWRSTSMPYLYEWNSSDNTLSITSSSTFSFMAMNSYLVQYAGTSIYWSAVNVTPASVAARQKDVPTQAEFRLELQQGEQKVDQAFIRLTDEENVTTGFDFNYDLSKEINATRSNVYTKITTVIEGETSLVEAAGNCLPLETEQVTTVPVGVTIKTAGEYTFAMPDGTEGMSVTLLDSEAGVTTDLSVETYQVELPAGTYENRFYMTIDPRNAATQIDIVGGEGDDVRTAKILRNGLLYIQRGDRIYDSTGRKLE